MNTLVEARALDRAEPLYLVEIALSGAGPLELYLAERDLEAGGVLYEGYLWGVEGPEWKLVRAGLSAPICSLGIRIQNEPWRGYSRLLDVGADFPFEGAQITLKEAYMGPDDIPCPPVALFKGLIDKVSSIDLMEFHICARSQRGSAGMT
jgi:hypothetical protein